MDTANRKQSDLDKRYIRMAAIWSENSYCQRRKVGALIVKDKMIISDGYNGTPSGFENICEDDNNVTKPYVLHAPTTAVTEPRCMLQLRLASNVLNSLYRQASNEWYTPSTTAWKTE